jgi:pimeloyl-ACP methyl ester carboxylesterase
MNKFYLVLGLFPTMGCALRGTKSYILKKGLCRRFSSVIPRHEFGKLDGAFNDDALLMDDGFIEANGVQVYFKEFSTETSPSHDAVVLLHGLFGSTESWSEIASTLALRLNTRVISFDRPAFGRTERVMPFAPEFPWSLSRIGRNPYSSDFAVELTLALLRKVNISRMILVSHSLGADCAARVAVRVQSDKSLKFRIASTIFIAPALQDPREVPMPEYEDVMVRYANWARDKILIEGQIIAYRTAVKLPEVLSVLGTKLIAFQPKKRIASSFHDPSKLTESIVNKYLQPLEEKDWERALLYYFRSEPGQPTAGSKLVEALKAATLCPSLVVVGAHDKTITPMASLQLAQELGARFVELAECGHIPMDECPNELIEVVARHCERFTDFKRRRPS